MGLDRKMVTHTVATSAQPGTTGPSEGEGDPWFEKPQKVTPHNQPAIVPHSEKRVHSTQWAPESQIFPIMPGKDSKWVVHEVFVLCCSYDSKLYFMLEDHQENALQRRMVQNEMKNLAQTK